MKVKYCPAGIGAQFTNPIYKKPCAKVASSNVIYENEFPTRLLLFLLLFIRLSFSDVGLTA